MEPIPLLSSWMKYLHCLFLDRKDIKAGMKTILTAIDEAKNGVSICIFPEGTRNKNESELDMLPFHEGSFKIATKSGCPIIPVSYTHLDVYKRQTPFITTIYPRSLAVLHIPRYISRLNSLLRSLQ